MSDCLRCKLYPGGVETNIVALLHQIQKVSSQSDNEDLILCNNKEKVFMKILKIKGFHILFAFFPFFTLHVRYLFLGKKLADILWDEKEEMKMGIMATKRKRNPIKISS